MGSLDDAFDVDLGFGGTNELVRNRAEEASRLPPAADPRVVQRMFEQVRQTDFDPAKQMDLVERARKLAEGSKEIRKFPRNVAQLAAQVGDTESRDLALEAYGQPPEEAPPPDTLGVLGVLDLPGRVGRMAVAKIAAPKGADTSWGSPIVRNREREWNQMVESELPVLHRAAQVVGVPVGGAIGGIVGAGIEGFRAATGQEASLDKIAEAAKSGAQVATDIVEQLPFDPTSYIGAPVRGAAGAAAVAERAALKQGLNAQRASGLKAAVAAAMEAPGAKQRADGVRKAFENFGADFNSVFGKQAEFVEAAPLRLGFAKEGFGVDVGKLTGSDFGVRKQISKALTEGPGAKLTKGLSPWSVERTAARETRRIARAVEGIVQKKHSDAAEEVMKLAPSSTQRQADLIEHFVDPDFQLSFPNVRHAQAVQDNPTLKGWFSLSSKQTGRDAEHIISTKAIERGVAAAERHLENLLAKPLKDRPNLSPQKQLLRNEKRIERLTSAQAAIKAAESKRMLVQAKAAPLPAGISPPTAGEQAWLDAYQGLFGSIRQDLVDRGMLMGKGRNLATGRYTPRQFTPEDADNVLRGALDFQKRRKLALNAGIPLGKFMAEQRAGAGQVATATASLNPSELITKQIGVASRKAAQHELKTSIERMFGQSMKDIRAARGMTDTDPKIMKAALQGFEEYGSNVFVDKRIHRLVEGTFKTGSLTQLAAKTDSPALKAAANVFETSRAWFKRNRLARPGFAFVNAVGDLGSAVMHGMSKPGRVLGAQKFWTGKKGAAGLTGPQLREEMLKHGIIRADSQPFKWSPTATQASTQGIDFAQEAGKLQARFEKAAKVPFKESGQKLERVADAARKIDLPTAAVQRINDAFGNNIRAAFFVDGLEKGLTPAASADRVMKALLDYGDAPTVVKYARIFFPFANFLFRAPVAAARGAFTSPARAAALPKAVQALNEPSEYGVPARALERGAGFTAGPVVRRGLESVIGKIPRGQDPFVLARDPASEAANPLYRLMTQGEATPLMQALGPEARAAVEALWTKKDLFTGEPIKAVWEEQGVVKGASPGTSRAIGAALRYLAPSVVPTWSDPFINAAAATSPGAPTQRVGFMRPVSPDMEQAQALRALSLFGPSVYMADPTTETANLVYDSEIQDRLDALTQTRKSVNRLRRINRFGQRE